MIITEDMLTLFRACEDNKQEFARQFPDGLDIGGLWLDYDARARTWRRILSDEFLRRYVGWAIGEGLLPARIIGDFSGADLRRAVLRRADLSGAVLSGADLRRADLSGAVLSGAVMDGAIVCNHTTGIDFEIAGLVKLSD